MNDYLTGQRFEVKVVLDKPRLLRIDFNALCRAEVPSGVSFLDWSGELTGVRLKALVWASIVYEPGEKRLEYDEVGDALNSTALNVVAALTEAVAIAMPDLEGLEKTTADPQKTATAKG
jgi:hypothetical protein